METEIYQENLSEKNFSIYFSFFFQCGWIISFLRTVSWNCFSEQKCKKCNPALQPHIQNAEKLQGSKDRILWNCPWKKSIGKTKLRIVIKNLNVNSEMDIFEEIKLH